MKGPISYKGLAETYGSARFEHRASSMKESSCHSLTCSYVSDKAAASQTRNLSCLREGNKGNLGTMAS